MDPILATDAVDFVYALGIFNDAYSAALTHPVFMHFLLFF
jgi:hypothetical protein